MKKTDRVFVLGFDGATFDLIDPMIREGELPCFKQVMDMGVRGSLLSTIPPISASAWTSLATGKNPGKHGILGFTRREKNTYKIRFVSGKDNAAETLWEWLGRYDRKSIVVNVPMTYPPKKINGLLISGLDTPGLNTEFTYPSQLKNEVFRIAKDYKINLALGGYLNNNRKRKEALRMIFSSIEARKRLILHLMKKHPWQFFMVRFNNPDTTQHHFWKYMDKTHPSYDRNAPEEFKRAIHDVYKKLDHVISSVLAALGPGDTLIIVSDHGAGSRINKAVYVNEWLKSRGYLERPSNDKGGKSSWFSSTVCYRLMEMALKFFLGNLSPELKGALKSRFPGLMSKTASYFKLSGIDWKRTRAFVGEVESIRINKKGDYPFGVVDNDYEELRDSIIREIKELHDPDTGERVIEEAYRREELFSGPYLPFLPEIILIPRENKYDVSWRFFNDARNGPPDSYVRRQEHWRSTSGMHRKNGIFIMQGPAARRGAEVDGMTIYDVMPTILYLMGLPIPYDTDGKVIRELFTDDFVKNRQVKYEDMKEGKAFADEGENVYSEKEQKTVEDFLRGLGYIE